MCGLELTISWLLQPGKQMLLQAVINLQQELHIRIESAMAS